jgi:predicted transcriptional regulator
VIEQLFGSKTRVKLLQLFLQQSEPVFFVREITRKIDEQINSVRRELSNLLSIGIITSDNTNNKLYYEVNQKFEYYGPLQQIFGGGLKKSAKKAGGQLLPGPRLNGPDRSGAVGHVELGSLHRSIHPRRYEPASTFW